MKKIIIPISTLFVTGLAYAQTTPSTTENYVYSKTYLSDPALSTPKTSETVQYFDGLGRPKQVVNIKASPLGRDVVTHIEYDGFGRQVKDFLPVPQSGTQNGAIVPGPLTNATQPGIYGSEKIYAEKVLENSPLDRILEQKQVGNDWINKPVKFGYDAVTVADRVKKFTTVTTWENGATKSVLGENWLYTDGQLYKTSVKDEDGNETIEFKNGQGQLILARKVIAADEYADTYYVYNEYNQLAFVIPPLASIRGDIATNTLKHDELCYQYRYDGRSRLVEKKLPGKGWEYMVYDKQDRLVATQDAELKNKGQWLYTKYDQFGRVAITGIGTGGARSAEQAIVDGYNSNNVNRLTTALFERQGIEVYYGNQDNTYPNSTKWVTLLSLNYYDSYPGYSFNPSFPSTIQGETVLAQTPSTDGRSTKGLPVMSLVKNIEDDNWTKNYTYYDTKGRSIGSHSINHLGGYTKTESKLDFAGVPQTVITRHKRLNTDTERVITENFTYDHQNRLLVHKHQVDSNAEEILAQNKYNELSQLENKKVGGISLGSPLQSIDYKYNIRGWMTKVNDPANLNGKLFGYEMRYTNPVYSNVAPGRFNGNIAEIDWNNASENVLKRYNYGYDNLNRLKDAIYTEPGSTNPYNNNFNENLTYDLNGNIMTLKRNAFPIFGTTSTLVDDLAYQYTGNRLDKVIENSLNDTGYEGGNNLIDYDLNGNMITMKDKGIQTIAYNYLNLPNDFQISQLNPFGIAVSFSLNYLYRADGTKLRKTYFKPGGRGNTTITNKITDYLDGFQYDFTDIEQCTWCRTDVAYEQQAFKDIIIDPGFPTLPATWTLDFVATSEGFYSFIENRYIYQYRDHLGNARVSYAKNSEGAVEITDTNNYYAFGLNHIGGLKGNLGGYQNYKYNGKELQETGMYDYGARMYMPDIGRWGVADELAEKSRRFSPYTYALDNPIMFVDPDGREAQGCCGNLWNLAKTYYSGMYQGAKSVAAGTYQGVKQVVTHPIESAKSLASNPSGALKSGISKSTNLMASVAAFPAIAGASVKKGDATVAGKIAGKALGTAVIEGGAAIATEGIGSAISSLRTAGRMSKLSSEVTATASELSAGGKAPATIVGAELNGQTTIATSGVPPITIAPQLEGVVSELGGIGTRTPAGNVVGCCAEFQAGNKLLLDNPLASPSQVNFTEAIRPRTGQTIPMCENCKTTFGK